MVSGRLELEVGGGRFDLGNMVQAVWSTAHGHPLRMTDLQGDQISRLAAHVDPVLVLFAPLYIGNLCGNDCQYCAFRRSNPDAVRRTLDPDEIRTWAQAAGLESLSVAELSNHPQVRAHVQSGIDQLDRSPSLGRQG